MKTVMVTVLLALAAMTAAQTPSTELISPSLVNRAGWAWDWQIKLPIRSDESVDRMVVYDQYLYILTDSAMLFCVDRAAGNVRFISSLSPRRLPVCDPIYVEKKLWFLIGNEVVLVDPWAGTVVQRKSYHQIGNTFECGLSLNESYLYITGSDMRLHAFSREGDWQAFTATADNDSPIISLASVNGTLLFATLSGNVVAMAEDKPVKLWQFDTTGAIHAGLVIDEGAVYVGSEDAKLYKLNIATGQMVWEKPFQAGAMLRDSVVAGKEQVYLPAGSMGVYGIDRQTGKSTWQVDDGVAVLTETDKHAFVLSRPSVLKVMDNKTGRQVYSVNVSQVTRYAVMMDEPKLYVADKTGRVAAVTVR